MDKGFLKSLALKAISHGFRIPEGYVSRINELSLLKYLLDTLNVNYVFDVGANQGQFAYSLRRIGYKGHLISFEPLRQEFENLSRQFKNDSKWQGYNVALGSENQKKDINRNKLTVLSSFLDLVDNEHNTERETVSVKRLDDMLPDLIGDHKDARIFLKMDTQGFDLEVFKGAGSCIDNIVGLQSELSVKPLYKGMPNYLEALEVYEQAGYELFNLAVEARTKTHSIWEINCSMKRQTQQ